MLLTDGLLAKKKQLENDLEEIDKKLHYYTTDGSSKHVAAYISDCDGVLHLRQDKIETKEECIAICEWYLKTVKEL